MTKALLLLLTLVTIVSAPAGARAQDGPVLRGRVVAADGAPTAGMRAYVRWSARAGGAPRTDSATVDSAGTFRVRLPAAPADSVDVVIDAAAGAPRTHHPVLARVARAEAGREHGFVLAPRAWTVTAGYYAGQTVPISPELAQRPACPGCGGFWVRMAGPPGPSAFQGWTSARFPLRVAFERAGSLPAGAAPDSAAFWRAVSGVEGAMGLDLFRPVPFAQTRPRRPDEDPDDVVLVHVDRALTTEGLTTMVGSRGNVEFAGLSLQRAGAALDRGGMELVQHELMHVLGLGHTCAWRSILADVTRCPGQRAATLTAEDVAYTQLLYRVRDLQRGGALRFGPETAVEGRALRALDEALGRTPAEFP